MDSSVPFKGGLTREQFLFREMRITAKLLNSGLSDDEVIKQIIDDNLFQYPTEKMIKNLASVCLKRLHNLESDQLVETIATGSSDSAKQVCLYAMMMTYRLVWEFMKNVIADKFEHRDYTYSKLDMNLFFNSIREQDEAVASWTDSTITKLKQVLNKTLIENGYIESANSGELIPVLIDFNLKTVLQDRNDKQSLAAFNCFEV